VEVKSLLETVSLEGLIQLFNIESKRNLEKYCQNFMVHQSDFVALILGARAGTLEPYRYACHFDQRTPSHLRATDEELSALSQNGVVPLISKAKKAVSKTFQLFEERWCFAAHLFYTPCYSYWYLFYFDQRDQAEEKNHWHHGAHIHLISSHWPNLKLEDVWRRVRDGQMNFTNKIHLRYLSKSNDNA